ncbi:MAG TPA: peptidylprolyl isomerase [Spirochaetota bacterium]|nr:peptidylprolyl isomerase [Spirochaetota bacterium]HOL57508.1 peptidylprolyl isomerase [Spirochaetota bacterium]HPP04078.1 peptidylprolyl isomerase [Spirochaetota bacterium]
MKRVIIFILILLIFNSCDKKNIINELDKSYFNYSKDFTEKLNRLSVLNKLLDHNKEIILIKTDLFYITNQYVLPFFYFEFEEYIRDLSDDLVFPLSKEEIDDYFLYVAESRAINQLMLIEAKSYGIDVTEGDVTEEINSFLIEEMEGDIEGFKNRINSTMFSYDFFEKERKESLIIEKYKKEIIFKDIEPTDHELFEYYNNNPSLSTVRERAIVRHILILTQNLNESQKRKKYELIKNIRDMAIKGADFSELAKKYSQDETTNKSGGRVGEYIERGQTFKEFEDAAFNTIDGGISDIIETEYGYHILKVDKIEKEKRLTFEEVKDKIYEIVKMDKEMLAFEQGKERLKKKYHFKMVF